MRNKTNKYPRLLLITANAFNPLSGGGITFTNLFHGWPKDKIACVHGDKIKPTQDVCERYYDLSSKEFLWAFPFSLLSGAGGQKKVEGAAKNARGITTKLINAAQFFISNEIPTKVTVSLELVKFIEDFKPDVIYTVLGSLPYMRLVSQVLHKFNLPVVIHIMDDWPAVRYGGVFDFYRRRRMDRELRSLINNASACLSICDAMSKAYKKRYSRQWQAFHNAVDAQSWIAKARKDWATKRSPFKILYAGALMTDSQLGSVSDVCDAVAQLKGQGIEIQFDIYAPWYAAKRFRIELEKSGCVSVFDAPETMNIEKLFTEADLLLLPVNFDEKSVKYIKYSMPTKVPAYMFSGTPTLAYGPDSVASIQYAQEWAHCVIKQNKTELCNEIKLLVYDEKLRERLGRGAQKLAIQKHDRAKVSAEFQEVLANSAKNFTIRDSARSPSTPTFG